MPLQSRPLETTRISRAELLSRRLEEEIVDSGLSAGARLGTKDDLRRRFAVANATVNEALRLLETRGMIEARPGPGGGVFVATPSSRVRLNHLVLGFKVEDAPFQDCLAVRNALEPMVCREAAKRCTAADADELRSLVAELEGAVDDPAEFLRINWRLHRRLVKMGGNAPLKTLYLVLLDYVEDGLEGVTGDESFDATANLAVHRELVEAIIAGETGHLNRAIERHTPMAERWGRDL